MSSEDLEEQPPESGQLQFGIRTLMVLTVMASLIANYLSGYGKHGFVVVGVAFPIAVLAGWLFGQLLGDKKIRIYWSVLTSVLFQIISANVFMLRYWDYFAWPIFAALAGSAISSPIEFSRGLKKLGGYNSTTRMLLGMLGGVAFYGAYISLLWLTGAGWSWQTAEFAAFSGAGILIGVLIEACIWTDKKFNISQLYVAFVLVVLAIIFATFAASLIPGW